MSVLNDHYKGLPQNTIFLEDNRSDAEKAAQAALLRQELIITKLRYIGIGIIIGLFFGLFIGIHIE